MKRAAIVSLDTSSSSWADLDALILGGFIEGPHADRISLRWNRAANSSIFLRGLDVLPALAQHDYLVLWHWVGAPVLEALRKLNPQLRIAFSTPFVTMPAGIPWQPVNEPNRERALQMLQAEHLLIGTDGNTVNPMERLARESYACALSLKYAERFARRVVELMRLGPVPDALFVDEMQLRPYWPARNAPPITLEVEIAFAAALERLTVELSTLCCPVWGNVAVDRHAFELVRVRYLEHLLRDAPDVQTAKGALARQWQYAGLESTLILGVMPDTPAQWLEAGALEQLARAVGGSEMFALQTLRTGSYALML